MGVYWAPSSARDRPFPHLLSALLSLFESTRLTNCVAVRVPDSVSVSRRQSVGVSSAIRLIGKSANQGQDRAQIVADGDFKPATGFERWL